jgi:hypothetical protein
MGRQPPVSLFPFMTTLTPMDSDTGARTILVIYTGGTIG